MIKFYLKKKLKASSGDDQAASIQISAPSHTRLRASYLTLSSTECFLSRNLNVGLGLVAEAVQRLVLLASATKSPGHEWQLQQMNAFRSKTRSISLRYLVCTFLRYVEYFSL